MSLKAEELEAIKTAAQEGTEQALIKFGFDTKNPIELQKDLAFVRKQRLASEQITSKARIVLLTIFLTGLGSIVTLGLREAMKTHTGG